MSRENLWRDASGRLTVDQTGIDWTEYPTVCREVADVFSLVPDGDFVTGIDQIFCDFRRGDQVVSIDWDNWMEFMVVAKTPSAEPLIHEIRTWLADRAKRSGQAAG